MSIKNEDRARRPRGDRAIALISNSLPESRATLSMKEYVDWRVRTNGTEDFWKKFS